MRILHFNKRTLLPYIMLGLLGLTPFVRCGDNPVNSQVGRLTLMMTDAPFPADHVSSTIVTVTRVEARNQSTEGNPFLTLSEETKTFNLLTLQNGITTELVDLDVPIGVYDQLRLFIGEARVTLVDGRTFNLTVPSGASSGLKINVTPGIEVQSALSVELTLDFDLSKSFVAQGNLNSVSGITGFIFKPVIRAMNTSSSGRIVGTVRDTASVAIEGATISAIEDTVITTTLTNADGEYTLSALSEGSYTVSAEKTGFITVQQSGASVTAGNTTTLNFQLTPQ